MSLWTVIEQAVLALPKALYNVGRAIAVAQEVDEAAKLRERAGPQDSTLRHTVEHRSDRTGEYLWCNRCQRTIPNGLASSPCEKAVRGRNALSGS